MGLPHAFCGGTASDPRYCFTSGPLWSVFSVVSYGSGAPKRLFLLRKSVGAVRISRVLRARWWSGVSETPCFIGRAVSVSLFSRVFPGVRPGRIGGLARVRFRKAGFAMLCARNPVLGGGSAFGRGRPFENLKKRAVRKSSVHENPGFSAWAFEK